MEILFVLLKNYQSPGEAFVVGGLTALVFSGAMAIIGAIRNARQRNKKEWEEVSYDRAVKTQSETDEDDIVFETIRDSDKVYRSRETAHDDTWAVEKEPDGAVKKTAKQSRKQKIQEENEYYQNHSAEEYLAKYPEGTHSREAVWFLRVPKKTYLSEYPSGRYRNDINPKTKNAIRFVIIFFIILVAFIITLTT